MEGVLEDSLPGSLAAFSQRPFDSRSACVFAWDEPSDGLLENRIAAARQTGAPVLLFCSNDRLYWWKQDAAGRGNEYLNVEASHLDKFFEEHGADLAPQTIYRAKTLGRFDSTHQREFVDLGLMPAVEKEMGGVIERLLLDQVSSLRDDLRLSKEISLEQGQWLVKSVFWLLGAKMLHDKRVERFIRLDFENVEQVFDRVARHYGQSAEAIISNKLQKRALQKASTAISSRADLSLATTEALGYVYENTLITKEVRKDLGTHSTPAYLIDYMVGRLEPRISSMKEDERVVFEPACGHGGFLVAAVRLLTSLLKGQTAKPEGRRDYLRRMIQGCDKDEFAIEIARLSLTLTDIPNPNGWRLQPCDAFESDVLERNSSRARILLANPPFEPFKLADRTRYSKSFRKPNHTSKAAEILHRSLAALPAKGVFGLVIPQTLLGSKDGKSLRKLLVEYSDFEEICLFPDKVFNFADVESAIIIGEKVELRSDINKTLRYRRVREGQMESFRSDYSVKSDIKVLQRRFFESESADLRIPDLDEIWTRLKDMPTLEKVVDIGQGFSFLGEDRSNFPKGQKRTSPLPREGFVEGFENLGKGVMSHQLPPKVFLNTDPKIILAERSGTKEGVAQILVNEAPRQRGPWCVTPMRDEIGRRVTTSFTIFRGGLSRKVLWAILSSPLANAFAYAHSSKWHLLTGMWRRFPFPGVSEKAEERIEEAASKYLASVHAFEQSFTLANEEDRENELEALRWLHWRMDAEVLKIYDLPAELERKLLNYFADCKRVGVPFNQDRYFPEHFQNPIGLADFIAITIDWEETNARRLGLIEKKLGEQLNEVEESEYFRLKSLAESKSDLVRQLPMDELRATMAELKRRGKWVEP